MNPSDTSDTPADTDLATPPESNQGISASSGVQAWYDSVQRSTAQSKKKFWMVVSAILGPCGLIVTALSIKFQGGGGNPVYVSSVHPIPLAVGSLLVVVSATTALSAWHLYGSTKAEFLQRHERQKVYMAIRAISNNKQLQQLINLNQAQMDAYHELTLAQAADAYRNTQAAMAIGFFVLLAGAVMVIAGSADATSRTIVGGLAGVGTALSGYVAATFLRAQQEALRQLNFYFRQPLVNSYLLTAERLAFNVPDELRPKTWANMADQVVAQAFGAPLGAPALGNRKRSGSRRSAKPSVSAANSSTDPSSETPG